MSKAMKRGTDGKFLRPERPGERLDRLMRQISDDLRIQREAEDRKIRAKGKQNG